MQRLWDYFFGPWVREKRVSGFKLDIDMKPRDTEDTRAWYRIKEVAYIPTNERDLLRLDMVKEMGLSIETGAVIDMAWKLTHNNLPGIYHNSFLVKTDLPVPVIFGKSPALNAIQGCTCPFDRATSHTYDESYDFSESRIKSWGWRRLSRGSLESVERKDNVQHPTSSRSKSLAHHYTRNNLGIEPIPLKAADTITDQLDTERDLKVLSAKNSPEFSNDQSIVESTTRVNTKSSDGREEFTSERVCPECPNESHCEDLAMSKNVESHDKHGCSDLNTTREKVETPPISKECQAEPSKSRVIGESCSVPLSSDLPRKDFPDPQNLLRRNQNSFQRTDSVVAQNTKSDASHSARSEHQHSMSGYKSKELLESELEKDIKPPAGDTSSNPYNQEATKAKKKAGKRRKAPKIRSAKSNNGQTTLDMDMTSEPDPGGWVYDPSAKAHYRVDSDTGSILWYSDSEDSDGQDLDTPAPSTGV